MRTSCVRFACMLAVAQSLHQEAAEPVRSAATSIWRAAQDQSIPVRRETRLGEGKNSDSDSDVKSAPFAEKAALAFSGSLDGAQLSQYAADIYGSYMSTNYTSMLPLTVPQIVKSSTHKGNKFRTESCGKIMTYTPTTYEWDKTITPGVLNLLEFKEIDNRPLPRVACFVYTFKGHRQHQRDSYATWGQDCDEFLVFSDETYHDNETGLTTIEVHEEAGASYNTIIQKLQAIFAIVQQRVKAGTLSFDFLAVSPDDAFWIIPNLKAHLATNERVQERVQKGLPTVYGHMIQPGAGIGGKGKDMFPSGAGYVLNVPALNAYLADQEVKGWKGPYEDVAMGKALGKIDGALVRAQESTGEHIIHTNSPVTLPGLYGYGNTRDWFMKSENFDLLHGKRRLDLIAKNSISFHTLSGAYRLAVHDYFYNRHC